MPAVEASSVLTVATAPAGEGPPQSALQVSRAARVKSLWNALRDSVIGEKATGGTELTGHLGQPKPCDMKKVAGKLSETKEDEEAAKALGEILNAALSEDQRQGTGQKLPAQNDFVTRKNAGGGLSSTDFNCAFPEGGSIAFDGAKNIVFIKANKLEIVRLISKADLENFKFFKPDWFQKKLLSRGESHGDQQRASIADMLIQARRTSTGDGGCQWIAQAVAERLRTGGITFTELEYEAFKHILSAALGEEENAATLEKFKQLFEEVAPVSPEVGKFYWDSGECSTARIVFDEKTGNIVFDTTKLGDTIQSKTILIEGDALKNFNFYGYGSKEKKDAYWQFAGVLNTSAASNDVEGGLLKLLGQARKKLTRGECQTRDMNQLQDVFKSFWGYGRFEGKTVNSGLQRLANDVLVEYLEHAGGLGADASAWPKLSEFVEKTLDCKIATQSIAATVISPDRFQVMLGNARLLAYSVHAFSTVPDSNGVVPRDFKHALLEARWNAKYGDETYAPRNKLECLMDVAYKRSNGNIQEQTEKAAFNDCMMGKITNDLKNAWEVRATFAGKITEQEKFDGARALTEILRHSIGIENGQPLVSVATFFMEKKFPIADVNGAIGTGWTAKIGWRQTQTPNRGSPKTDTSIVLRVENTANGGKPKEYKLIKRSDLERQNNPALWDRRGYPKFAEALNGAFAIDGRDDNTHEKAIADELFCLLEAADEKARKMTEEAQTRAGNQYGIEDMGRKPEEIQHSRNVELPEPQEYDEAAQAKFRKCQGPQRQESRTAEEERQAKEAEAARLKEKEEEEAERLKVEKEEAERVAEGEAERAAKEAETAEDQAKRTGGEVEAKEAEAATGKAAQEPAKEEEQKEEAARLEEEAAPVEEQSAKEVGAPPEEKKREQTDEGQAGREGAYEVVASPAEGDKNEAPVREEPVEDKVTQVGKVHPHAVGERGGLRDRQAASVSLEATAEQPVEQPRHAPAPPRDQHEPIDFLANNDRHENVQSGDVAGPKHVQVNVRASPVVVDVHSCAPGSGFLQRCGDDRKTTGKPRLRGGKGASAAFLKKRPGKVGNENAEKSCGFFGWCGSTATAPTSDDGNTASTPRLRSLTAQAVPALPGESSLLLLICVFAAAAVLRLAVHRCHARG